MPVTAGLYTFNDICGPFLARKLRIPTSAISKASARGLLLDFQAVGGHRRQDQGVAGLAHVKLDVLAVPYAILATTISS